jgi:hypothetical protein
MFARRIVRACDSSHYPLLRRGVVPHETTVAYRINRSGFAALRLRQAIPLLRSPLRRRPLAWITRKRASCEAGCERSNQVASAQTKSRALKPSRGRCPDVSRPARIHSEGRRRKRARAADAAKPPRRQSRALNLARAQTTSAAESLAHITEETHDLPLFDRR